jgi:hypothetical protein
MNSAELHNDHKTKMQKIADVKYATAVLHEASKWLLAITWIYCNNPGNIFTDMGVIIHRKKCVNMPQVRF